MPLHFPIHSQYFAVVADENDSMSGINGTGAKVARFYSHSPELSNREDAIGRKNGEKLGNRKRQKPVLVPTNTLLNHS